MNERKRKWNPGSDLLNSAAAVWLVPVAALVIGGWMLYQHLSSQGPLITLTVSRAEGIVAGKTAIRSRDVDIGKVESVELSSDYSQAIIQARIAKHAEQMLRQDSLFWVVKPRIGREGVSGLGTLLSGAYIELAPGKSVYERRQFQILEKPPMTSLDQKGRRIILRTKSTNALSVGAPIHYRGFNIGQIEAVNFVATTNEIEYKVFIAAPYDVLVTSNIRFWQTPAFQVSVNSSGVKMKMDSLESLLDGGITMGLPDGWSLGNSVTDGTEFALFADEESVLGGSFDQFINYVIPLEGNLAGLNPGSSVEFRGVRVGTVIASPYISDNHDLKTLEGHAIPVLIRIEIQRLSRRFDFNDKQKWQQYFEELFKEGLRASVRTSNLVTGSKIVDINFYSDAKAYKPTQIDNTPVFPTTKVGIEQIERKVNRILDNLAAMDMGATLEQVNKTLVSLEQTLKSANEVSNNLSQLTGQSSTQQLPESVNKMIKQLDATLATYDADSRTNQELQETMDALNQMMREMKPLLRSVNEQPNSLIFNRDRTSDPEPKAGK